MSNTLTITAGLYGARELTLSEVRWLRRMDRVMRDAPPGFVFATTSDSLEVWCAEVHREMRANDEDDCDGAVHRRGGCLASLSAFGINGVSG